MAHVTRYTKTNSNGTYNVIEWAVGPHTLRKITKDGETEYSQLRIENDRELSKVSVHIDEDFEWATGTIKGYSVTVNWPSIGSVDPSEAAEFARDMNLAVQAAHELADIANALLELNNQ